MSTTSNPTTLASLTSELGDQAAMWHELQWFEWFGVFGAVLTFIGVVVALVQLSRVKKVALAAQAAAVDARDERDLLLVGLIARNLTMVKALVEAAVESDDKKWVRLMLKLWLDLTPQISPLLDRLQIGKAKTVAETSVEMVRIALRELDSTAKSVDEATIHARQQIQLTCESLETAGFQSSIQASDK